MFERIDKEGYSVARHIFGTEPSDPEIYEFVLSNFNHLKFGDAKEINVQIHRKNPKRVQREVRREMEKLKESTRPSTLAQDYLKEELDKKKKEKKVISSVEKQARRDAQFFLRQEKKKLKGY